MHCSNCGQARQGAERFCANCGTDLMKAPAQAAPVPQSGIVTPQAAVQAAPPAVFQAAAAPVVFPATPAAPAAEDLTGVGGWLLLFCIILTIFDPLWSLRLIPVLRYGLTVNPILFVSFGLTAYGVFTGIMLWTRNPSALTCLRVYFALVVVVALAGVFTYFRAIRVAGFSFQMAIALLRVAAFLGIWVSYFRVSKRVRATYGANL
jgi:hypothetical protein